jgi:hypothetical protein
MINVAGHVGEHEMEPRATYVVGQSWVPCPSLPKEQTSIALLPRASLGHLTDT